MVAIFFVNFQLKIRGFPQGGGSARTVGCALFAKFHSTSKNFRDHKDIKQIASERWADGESGFFFFFKKKHKLPPKDSLSWCLFVVPSIVVLLPHPGMRDKLVCTVQYIILELS